MKSFKQFNEAYTDRFAQQGTEDETHAYFNVEDPVAMQKLNAYVGSVADKEYLQPDAAMHQLAMRLGTVGLTYTLPKIEGGLILEFNWEKEANNTYQVFANLV